MRAKLLTAAILMLVQSVALAEAHPGFEAICRIQYSNGSGGKSTGTGTVFMSDDEYYHILTNAHVVGNQKNVEVEFWHEGHKSVKMNGYVRWKSYAPQPANRDMAVVDVRKSYFRDGPKPKIVPLAPRGTKVGAKGTVTSVGCSRGVWPTAWEGHVFRERGPVYDFLPAPAGGRSGSALYDPSGKQIVGLIAWRSQDNRHGVAMTLEEIYRAFEGKGPVNARSYSQVKQVQVDCWTYAPSAHPLVPVMFETPYVQYEVTVCQGGGGDIVGVPYVQYVQNCPPGQFCPNPYVQPYVPRQPMPDQRPQRPPGNGGGSFPTYPGRQDPPRTDPPKTDPPVTSQPPDLSDYAKKVDLDALAERVGALETRIETLDSSLTVQITDLETRVSELQTSTMSLTTMIETLTTKIEEGGGQVDAQELVTLIKNDQTLIALLKGEKGDPGDNGSNGNNATIDDTTIDLIVQRVVAILDEREPDPNDSPEINDENHIVIVADLDSGDWPSLSSQVEDAKRSYHRIVVTGLPDFSIGTIPQAIEYRNGTPVRVTKGRVAVTKLLGTIRRGHYEGP